MARMSPPVTFVFSVSTPEPGPPERPSSSPFPIGATTPPFPAPTVERLLFERLMESLPDTVYFKDREGRFICVNNAHAQHVGMKSPSQVIGKTDYDFFAHDLAKDKDHDEREIVRSGIGIEKKEESSKSISGSDQWVLTTKLPLYGPGGEIIGTFGISRDITEATRSRRSLEEQHELLRTLIEILPARVSIKDREGRFRLVNEAYRESYGLPVVEEIKGKLLSELVTDSRISQIAADDRKVLEEGASFLNREELEISANGGKRWILLSKVPLRGADGTVQGIVAVGTDITAQKDAEVRALEAQHALEEKNRQMEAELALACELQTELMTSSLQSVAAQLTTTAPFSPHFASLYEPSAHLAGDFFHLTPMSPTTFGLMLCDVMGHGLKAALVTTLIRGLLTDMKADALEPATALELMNERLCPLLDRPALPRFVTALFAKVDTQSGKVEVSSAGHPWPLHKTGPGTAAQISLGQCGPALGLIRGANYGKVEFTVSKGSQLLCFTDGLIEETNPAGEEYGIQRLTQSLAKCTESAPSRAIAHLALGIRDFTTKSAHNDDHCALMLAF
ncbi:hypothetical protein DB347_21560 [Opitutaceae bacterium EW11]|nr:hypothetical protein DB347_21560 [Opitutaceae bacterium EW11]